MVKSLSDDPLRVSIATSQSELAKQKIFGITILVLWLVSYVNGLLPQVEIYLLNGNVSFKSGYLKLIIIIALLFMIILAKKSTVNRRLFVLWAILIAYLSLDSIFIQWFKGYGLYYLVFSAQASYYGFLVLPLFWALKGSVPQRRVLQILLPALFMTGGIGIAQYMLNSPILSTMSENRQFYVYTWNFFGQVRSFGLFTMSYFNGYFLIFGLSLLFVMFRKTGSSRKPVLFIFLLINLFALYVTLTRAVYFEALLALVTAMLLSNRRKRFQIITFLPFIYGCLGAFLLIALPAVEMSYLKGGGKIISDASLMMRFHEWRYWGSIVFSRWDTSLFGLGLIQTNFRFPWTIDVVIDNTYLATIVQNGLVGLAIWSFFAWFLWTYSLRIAREYGDPFSYAIVSVVSVWFFAGMFNNILSNFIFVGIFYPLLLAQRVGGERYEISMNLEFSAKESLNSSKSTI